MHTVMVIAGALALLALCVALGRFLGTGQGAMAKAALYFIPLWLIGAAVNMWVGVAKAGYTVMQELPIFLIVFAVPAAVALALWWMWSGNR
jgi:hypothetical protein